MADVMPQIAACLGYESDVAMNEGFQNMLGSTNITYAIVANKPSTTARALQFGHGGNPIYSVEHCFLFENNTSVVAAHELLHLYGAEDIYNSTGYRANREISAQQLCPDDIMLTCRNGSIIDTFTAYTIGWLDTIPEEYSGDDWWS